MRPGPQRERISIVGTSHEVDRGRSAMTYVFLEHPSSLEHDTSAYGSEEPTIVHPDQVNRITAIHQELSVRGWLGFERVLAPAVDRSVLRAVHPEAYIASIEQAYRSGRRLLDGDTVVSERSFDAALYAAGGAVRMVELLLDGEASAAFSSHRPPGHHALPSHAMGFCLFNNVAVAARHALDARGLERVMIIDWDVHHGNSTSRVFRASRKVLYVSIHQSPLFPWTGRPSEVGEGDGAGFTVNLPVPPGSGNEVWVSLIEHVVVPLAYSFEPQLVLISAGYDAHRDDPVADCTVTEEGFAEMTRAIARVCASLSVPLGAVLEGGYALGALGRSVASTLQALSSEPAARAISSSPAHFTPIARHARRRLAEFWHLRA